MEDMRTILVNLDTGLGIVLRIGIAADMTTPFDNDDLELGIVGSAFGNGRAVKTGTDNHQVCAVQQVHRDLMTALPTPIKRPTT